eukprot:TRINITY_DN19274_c0_g2_i1.p2 TRINITY_DN19274_c0_g2~~TRINITY_DN19274_c0_g2_i1.p2  ORF type:complete len:123 (+),score=33.76 TRINITY_DN19274_c0_g2_i1:408-776(+)
MLPARLKIFVSVAEYAVQHMGGVSLQGAWNGYLHHEHGTASYFGVRLHEQGMSLCAEPVCVLDIALDGSGACQRDLDCVQLIANQHCAVNAAVWFFEVDLDSQERLSNAPLGDDTHLSLIHI